MEQYQKKPGSYRSLKAYQKAECVYDITYYFVEHFLDRGHDRTAIIVIHQTLALLRGLIDRIDRLFLQEGGIKEQRYQMRKAFRDGGRDFRDNRESRVLRDSRETPNQPTNPKNPTNQP